MGRGSRAPSRTPPPPSPPPPLRRPDTGQPEAPRSESRSPNTASANSRTQRGEPPAQPPSAPQRRPAPPPSRSEPPKPKRPGPGGQAGVAQVRRRGANGKDRRVAGLAGPRPTRERLIHSPRGRARGCGRAEAAACGTEDCRGGRGSRGRDARGPGRLRDPDAPLLGLGSRKPRPEAAAASGCGRGA